MEIIASMLDVCRYGAKRTRVMGQCNLSFRQLESYLDVLLKANLLLIENDSRSFLLRVSGKGKDFLQTYDRMMTMLE
jgi:predicted transcriptional regulator